MPDDAINQDIVSQLSASRKDFKGVYPVLNCLQHPAVILSGRHRERAGWTNKQPIDVEKWAKQWAVPHVVAEERIRNNLNIQRKVEMKETQESVEKVARGFSKDSSIPKDTITERTIQCFPHLTPDYVRDLVPAEFKSKAKSDAGRAGGIEKSARMILAPEQILGIKLTKEGKIERIPAQVETPPQPTKDIAAPLPPKPEPFAKGQSPSSKLNNPAQFTEHAVTLFNLVNGIEDANFLQEERFLRENPADADEYSNELNKDGTPKSYQSDIVEPDLHLILEAIGEGTSSNDAKRDEYFQKKGFEVLKFENEDIERSPHLVKWIVELKVELALLKKKQEVAAR